MGAALHEGISTVTNSFDEIAAGRAPKAPKLLMDAGAIKIREATDEVIRALNKPGPHRKVFQYAGQAVVVTSDRSRVLRDLENGDPITRSVPRPANRGLLQGPIEAVSEWQKYDGRTKGYEERPAPPWIFSMITDIYGEGLKPLAGIADFPVVGPGKKLLVGRMGYDPNSYLYVDCEPVPYENHEFDSPQEAYKFLAKDWLGEFHFATEEDRARALTIPLTILQRRTRISGGSPIPFITAPDPETGKTKLAECLVEAISNQPLPVTAWDHDNEAERRKSLLSLAMENPAAVLFDNINNGWAIKDASLEKYATSDFFSDRLLGKNESATAPATSLLIFTGNNIVPGSIDLESRSFIIRMQRPAKAKKYKREDPLSWTRKNRALIMAALMTILKAEVAGKWVPHSRFPVWSRLVAGPIQYACGNNELFKAWAPSAAAYHNEELEALLHAMANVKSENFNDYGYAPGEMSKTFSELIYHLEPGLTAEFMQDRNKALIVGNVIPPKWIYRVLRKYDGHLAGKYRMNIAKIPLRASQTREAWHFKALVEEID